jgi:mRNA-degrading endonuclease RelE of RelBE toxin-antitoxin system
MKSKRTKQFRALFEALPEAVQRQANDAYRLFKSNPYHPSLHFKPIDPADPSIYSARVSKRYRVVGVRQSDDLIVWYWIGIHGDYDKLT